MDDEFGYDNELKLLVVSRVLFKLILRLIQIYILTVSVLKIHNKRVPDRISQNCTQFFFI